MPIVELKSQEVVNVVAKDKRRVWSIFRLTALCSKLGSKMAASAKDFAFPLTPNVVGSLPIIQTNIGIIVIRKCG